MAEEKNKVQEAIDQFRKDGIAYLSDEDLKLSFDNLFPEPDNLKDNKTDQTNKK